MLINQEDVRLNYHITVDRKKKDEYINKILGIVPFVTLFIFMIILHRFEKMQIGDDHWFQQVTPNYTFLGYVKWRYLTWSGRVSVESVLYFIFRDNGSLWKVINPIVITLFAYGISRIVVGNGICRNRKYIILNCYICIGWLFISNAVLQSSVLWITGSINYIWPMTAGLLAIIPFRDALLREYSTSKYNIIYLISAIFASFGQEQVTLVLVAFSTIINVHIFLRDKKIYKYLVFQNIIMLIGTLIILLAPGNFIRNHAETNNWLPNYPLYSKWEIGFYGIQWLMNNLLNDCRIIFMLLLAVLSIALYKKNKGLKGAKSVLIPIIGCFLILFGILFSLDIVIPTSLIGKVNFPNIYRNIWNYLNNVFFNFNLSFAIRKISVIKFFLWPVVIVTIPYFIVYICDFKTKGFYMALIYIAGICTALILFISPTIYASGQRTLFVLSTSFFIVFIILLKNEEWLLDKKYLILFSIVPVIKYIYLIQYLLKL